MEPPIEAHSVKARIEARSVEAPMESPIEARSVKGPIEAKGPKA